MVFLFTILFLVQPVFAQPPFDLLEKAGEASSLNTKVPGNDLQLYIGTIVGNVLSFISVAFFGLMIYAGVRWMMSRGSEEEAKKSLNIILGAVIGIVIVLSSYTLVKFMFSSVKQTPPTKLGICCTYTDGTNNTKIFYPANGAVVVCPGGAAGTSVTSEEISEKEKQDACKNP